MKRIIKLPRNRQKADKESPYPSPSEPEKKLRVVDESASEPAVRLENPSERLPIQKKEKPPERIKEKKAKRGKKLGFFKKGRLLQSGDDQHTQRATEQESETEEHEEEGTGFSLKQFFLYRFFTRLPQKVDEKSETDDEEKGVILLTQDTHRSDSRSQEPHVADLLNNDDEFPDAEDDWGDARLIVPIGWFFLVGLLLCGAFAWAIYDVFQAQPEIKVVTIEKQLLLDKKREDDKGVQESLVLMAECVRGYFKAKNISELLQHVRLPERVKPLMAQYYRTKGRRKPTYHHIAKIRPIPFGRQSFVHVKIALKGGGHYYLLLEELPDGTFRVDWEDDVSYQSMPWREYLTKRPLKPVDMRVRVIPDHFYGFAFRDQKRYQCYRLKPPASNQYLFGYVERGSELAQLMEIYMADSGLTIDSDESPEQDLTFEEGGLDQLKALYQLKADPKAAQKVKPKPGRSMILRLRFLLEDNSRQCVKIEDILSDQWVYYNFTKPTQGKE
ncbi:MAG: hypothetical protein KJO21_08500 [Verrucomicrobiae bacterium]|nr:hypothetical protein [Verrucomicrobiae bacterium]NNJ43513.1 hypothetical protein [Akkermansiaceae bacterium]